MSEKSTETKRINVDAKTSDRSGLAGFFETLLRKFRLASYIIALIPLYLLAILAMAISLAAAVYLYLSVTDLATELTQPLYSIVAAICLVGGYFVYGFTLIFVAPLFNFLMPFRLKSFRSSYYSLESVPWYFHNAYTYMVRYTFLEFVTPTPINILFYKMMGMKIGKNAHINTTNISDPCMIEVGDNVTIGGSVHIIAHYASKGFLVVDKVKIHDRVTIGLKASIMGAVEIGEGAVIGPHEVILPKTKIPAGRRPKYPEWQGEKSAGNKNS
jgi:hypothetical protein